MSATGDRLRSAADLVDNYKRGTTPGPWSPQHTVDTLGTVKLHAGPVVNGYLDGLVMEWTGETIEEYGGEPSVQDLCWIALMSPLVAEPLALWMRSEAIQFETSERRGSPYGYPSWHFACALLGADPSAGGFDTLPVPEPGGAS